MNKMNQQLAESIQKKKKLREKLKEMKQKQETQRMVWFHKDNKTPNK